MADGLRHRAPVLVAIGIILSAMLALVGMSAFLSRTEDIRIATIITQLQRQLDSGIANPAYADDGHSYLPMLRAFYIRCDAPIFIPLRCRSHSGHFLYIDLRVGIAEAAIAAATKSDLLNY